MLTEPQRKALGERIRAARENAGFSQAGLADAVGVRAGTVWRYEDGRTEPKVRILWDIAQATGVSMAYLLGGAPTGTSQLPEGLRRFRESYAPSDLTEKEFEAMLALPFELEGPAAYVEQLELWRSRRRAVPGPRRVAAEVAHERA